MARNRVTLFEADTRLGGHAHTHFVDSGDGNIVETYVSYLRRKVDAGRAPLIHTVRGVGYTMKPTVRV